jgi:putative oxidoreductase
MHALNQSLNRLAPLSPAILRVILGVGFFVHGYTKVENGLAAEGFAGFIDGLGVPAPTAMAPVVAFLEMGLGILLVVGFMTRISSIILFLLLVGAVAYFKNDGFLFNGNQNGAELDLVYMAGLASLAITGPGRFSVDHSLRTDTTVIDLRDADSVTTAAERQLADA